MLATDNRAIPQLISTLFNDQQQIDKKKCVLAMMDSEHLLYHIPMSKTVWSDLPASLPAGVVPGAHALQLLYEARNMLSLRPTQPTKRWYESEASYRTRYQQWCDEINERSMQEAELLNTVRLLQKIQRNIINDRDADILCALTIKKEATSYACQVDIDSTREAKLVGELGRGLDIALQVVSSQRREKLRQKMSGFFGLFRFFKKKRLEAALEKQLACDREVGNFICSSIAREGSVAHRLAEEIRKNYEDWRAVKMILDRGHPVQALLDITDPRTLKHPYKDFLSAVLRADRDDASQDQLHHDFVRIKQVCDDYDKVMYCRRFMDEGKVDVKKINAQLAILTCDQDARNVAANIQYVAALKLMNTQEAAPSSQMPIVDSDWIKDHFVASIRKNLSTILEKKCDEGILTLLSRQIIFYGALLTTLSSEQRTSIYNSLRQMFFGTRTQISQLLTWQSPAQLAAIAAQLEPVFNYDLNPVFNRDLKPVFDCFLNALRDQSSVLEDAQLLKSKDSDEQILEKALQRVPLLLAAASSKNTVAFFAPLPASTVSPPEEKVEQRALPIKSKRRVADIVEVPSAHPPSDRDAIANHVQKLEEKISQILSNTDRHASPSPWKCASSLLFRLFRSSQTTSVNNKLSKDDQEELDGYRVACAELKKCT